MKTICTNCQAENNSEATLCSACGYALPVPEVPKAEAELFNYKPKKKKNPIVILLFVVCFWAALFGIRTLLKPTVEDELAKVAENTNRGCPIQVDQYTRLVRVVAMPNKTIQYNYDLNEFTKAEVNIDTLKKYVFPSLLKNVKENPQAKVFRDNEITIKYKYKDKKGEVIAEYVITPKMYQ
ncbi:zinc-ribbon domain-containing protein [Flavobacterium phycosphaerae]|uniref:zinc-ribbon domain-containing protein n=1 Tax=Flavobacterium phycosphaerae TaxID=2697515 RepID=UPI001389859D|nr:zinc-ribbon domain-containing protein [Flavobacterium phycosphaerae]